MQTIEVSIIEVRADGRRLVHTRWAHTDKAGHWSSATNLGRDYVDHSDEAAARAHMAGWLRSQGTRIMSAPAAAIAGAEPPLILQPGDQEMIDQAVLAAADMLADGTGFLNDGKRVPPDEVFKQPVSGAEGLEDLL
jgi:hypothetical protein